MSMEKQLQVYAQETNDGPEETLLCTAIMRLELGDHVTFKMVDGLLQHNNLTLYVFH